MINTLRLDLRSEEIDITLVCPGFVETPLTQKNDFPMPFQISVQEASQRIKKGIAKRTSEIHFPRRFTYLLKFLGLLPTPVWTLLARGLVRNGK